MNSKYENFEKYEIYEEQFNPLKVDRQARRKRRSKLNFKVKQTQEESISHSADPVGLEAGLNITYKPARHEADWLFYSLRPFL